VKYLTIEEGRRAKGLRLVLVAGTPGAWGECIKAVYHVKQLAYQPVAQLMGEPNEDLRAWTGQTSAPVAAYDDERIRIGWENKLWQAEQLAPEPPLIPKEARARALMFGVLRELAGECGLAWDRRLQSIAAAGGPEASPVLAHLANKYGYNESEVEASKRRVAQVLGLCSDLLEEQREAGSAYYIGNALTALDLYSAVLTAVMIDPLPHALCPMPAGMRAGFSAPFDCLKAARPILLEHRDFIFEHYLPLPMDF
jgi:glutathione S-transferase